MGNREWNFTGSSISYFRFPIYAFCSRAIRTIAGGWES
jgi:hypothetical protein